MYTYIHTHTYTYIHMYVCKYVYTYIMLSYAEVTAVEQKQWVPPFTEMSPKERDN